MTSKQGIEATRLQAKADTNPLALTLSEVTDLAMTAGRTPYELAHSLLGGKTEPYVRAREVADFLGGISVQSVHQWRKAGKISGIKPGKEWLFILSDVRAELARVQPEPKPVQSPQSRGRRRLGG
jgi:hypothetical protein